MIHKRTESHWMMQRAYCGLSEDQFEIAILPVGHGQGDKDLVIFASEGSHEDQYGNAKLMVAAQDLLKSLKNIRSELFLIVAAKHGEEMASKWPEIVEADAAIAKATVQGKI